MDIRATGQAISSLPSFKEQGEIQVALMKKALDAQKTEGQNLIDLLKQSAGTAQVALNHTPGKGQIVDLYA